MTYEKDREIEMLRKWAGDLADMAWCDPDRLSEDDLKALDDTVNEVRAYFYLLSLMPAA